MDPSFVAIGYCIAMWAISIHLFDPHDNVGNRTIRLFAPITLPLIGAAWTAGHVVRIIRVAPVMGLGTLIFWAALAPIIAKGYGGAYAITTYLIGALYLVLTKVFNRHVAGIHFAAFALSPLSMPFLGLVALEEFAQRRCKPKPSDTDHAKPADPPTQHG